MIETSRILKATVSQNRRDFLKSLGTAAGGVFVGNLTACQPEPAPAESTGSRSSHLVQFGHTDLYVSKLCQGTAFRTHLSREGGDKQAHDLIRHCIDIGINFFDSAEGYGSGGSETALGRGIAGRRDQVIIATKGGPHLTSGERLTFTQEILMSKAEASLRRLGTDYIDLYLLHDPDEITPSKDDDVPPPDTPTRQHMEEIVSVMDALVLSGKIRYWGVSNHLARQVDELVELSRQPGISPIAGLEDSYCIAGADPKWYGWKYTTRDFMMNELFPVIRKGNLGLMAFGPLGGGQLVPGRKVEEGSPLADLIAVLDEVANQLSVSRPQVCVAWVAAHPEVTSVLAGAEKPEHVEDNFKGTELVLPQALLQKLNIAADTYAAQIRELRNETA